MGSTMKRDINHQLLILKLQNKITGYFKSAWLASIITYYTPLMAIGLWLQIKYNYPIFSEGVIVALLWLAICPALIQKAILIIYDFFEDHKDIFINHEQWSRLKNQELQRFQSSRYLLFGVPWAISLAFVIWYSLFIHAPLPVQLWSLIVFFMMFVMSAIGFQGIYVIITIIGNICKSELVFRPFHPDKFGGFSRFGSFAVKGTIFFSSGALVFPLAFEVFRKLGGHEKLAAYLVVFLFSFFILVLILSFLLPIFQIKYRVDMEKEKIILEARAKLDKMVDSYLDSSENELNKPIKIATYYYLNYNKLLEIKDYPWDLKVLFEFAVSFIIPIGIALIQIYSK